jgi:hypothetical protein
MSKVILIILLLGGITFWWHWKNTPDPQQRKKLVQKTIIGVLIVALLLMVVTGRIHWIGAVFAGLLATMRQIGPFLIRYFPMITQLYRGVNKPAQAPGSSTVTSRIIEMTLDHNSGKLTGKILEGQFKGRPLDELDHNDLMNLYDYCKSNDLDSARLLESYLADRFGEQQKYESYAGKDVVEPGAGIMSVSEALQVLGLEGKPNQDEITRAYRKLMQQLHPDRGGNQYFAAKANVARETLLKQYG